MKKINRHVAVISVQWLKSLMPNEEEANKITAKNYREYLKQSPFYFKDNQIFNSSFTEKWTRRKLRKLLEETLLSLLTVITILIYNESAYT